MKNLTTVVQILLMLTIHFSAIQMRAQSDTVDLEKQFIFQNQLYAKGIDLEASFVGDYFANIDGGIKKGNSYVNNVIISAGLDFDKIVSINGLSTYASALGINGGMFVENTGAIQGISNIAGVNHWKLYELWAEQKLLNETLSVLFGLYDLNSEFDVRESSGIFINPSFGIGFDFAQSGQNGPSIFPYTSLALRIKYSISESVQFQTALFDGVPGSLNDEKGFHVNLRNDEGFLIANEFIFSPPNDNYYSKFSIGGWYYTSEFENATNGNYEKGNFGFYVSGEQQVYSENSSCEQGLTIFGRFGIANSNFNAVDYSVLGGLNYIGLFPNREEDVIGIAFTSVHLDEQFRDLEEIDLAFETILELTYSLQIIDWVRLQPDIQFIFNPVFAKEADYAITTGMRAEIAF